MPVVAGAAAFCFAAAAAASMGGGLQVLATGWQEMRDPKGVYYVNQATGETSWEKPLMAAPSEAEADAVQQQAWCRQWLSVAYRQRIRGRWDCKWPVMLSDLALLVVGGHREYALNAG